MRTEVKIPSVSTEDVVHSGVHLKRQEIEDPWGSLASDPGLIGELQAPDVDL